MPTLAQMSEATDDLADLIKGLADNLQASSRNMTNVMQLSRIRELLQRAQTATAGSNHEFVIR